MSTREELTFLLVTPTDYFQMWNNVEHPRVRYYSRIGRRMTVIHKKMNREPGLLKMAADSVTCRVRIELRDGVQFVQVDPFFNYYAGLRGQAEAVEASATARGISVKALLMRLLSPLSVLRDVFSTPCLLAAALRQGEGSYDICIGVGPWGSAVGWLMQKMGRIGVLIYLDRDYEPGLMPDRLRQTYTSWLERFLMPRAQLVVSVGERLARLRRQEIGRSPSVIPNGIELQRFRRPRVDGWSGRRMIYVGNLVSWCGLETAIAAMPRILAVTPDAELVVIGTGLPAYERKLEALCESLQVSQAVEFVGSKQHHELPDILAEAAIGVANSEPVLYRQYACPLKVVEYAAAGLPSIVTTETEAADLVERYGCGVAVPFDADSFASAAIELLTDKDRWSKLHRAAVAAGDRLDWEVLLAGEWREIQSVGAAGNRNG